MQPRKPDSSAVTGDLERLVQSLAHFMFLVKEVDSKFPGTPQKELLKTDGVGTSSPGTIRVDLH